MNFCCQCEKCGEQWWCRGYDESETNATVLTGPMQSCPECGSEDFYITQGEVYDDD